jgi:hypothetical protein
MADTASGSGAPGDRPAGEEDDSRREPGRNESMNQEANDASITQLVASGDPIALAAIASVFLSLFTFYVRKNKQQGIFMGLWAPTLLALASYVQRRTGEQ